MDSSSWGQKSVAGSCEDGNELLSSIKYGEFVASFRLLLTLFHTVQNIRKTCAAGPQHDIRITISSNAIIGTRRLRRTKYNPTWIPVCIREVPGSSLRLRDRTFFFVSPSHSVQIPKQYLQIRPRPLPIAPFPIHNLLITVIWRHVVVINKKAKKKDKVRPRTGHESPEEKQRYSSTLSLTSALDRWGGWLTPRHGRFIPGKESWYLFYRRLGGLQGRSERVRKISPHRDSIPEPSSPQQVAIPTTLSQPTIIFAFQRTPVSSFNVLGYNRRYIINSVIKRIMKQGQTSRIPPSGLFW